MPDCLFCKIVAGEIPAELVAESGRTIAFRDINPQAPTHVLVIPKEHHPDLAAMAAADSELLAEVAAQAHRVAEAEGIASGGYRVVFNTGVEAGQTVFHAHAHVLGGRPMTWPPGWRGGSAAPADSMGLSDAWAGAHARRRQGIDGHFP